MRAWLRMVAAGVVTAATLAVAVATLAVVAGGMVLPALASPVHQVAGTGGADGPELSGPDGFAAPVFSGSRPPAEDNLAGVSCASASFCVAVGWFRAATVPAGIVRSLALEWNGRRWRVLRSAQTGGDLLAVSCVSMSFCMAVGADASGLPLAEAWNGRTWRVLKAPPGPNELDAISCARVWFCVGLFAVSDGADQWNGRTWRAMNMSGDGCVRFVCALGAVSCPGAGSCMAVGSFSNRSGSVRLGEAVTWNGRTWRDTRPPSPGRQATLDFVSCASTSRCLAVGNNRRCGCALIVAWNGRSWQQLASPGQLPDLRTMSCPRADSCVAVGGQGAGSSAATAAAWDGRAWQRLAPAEPGKSERVLFDVSCWRPSACMAVGSYSTAAAFSVGAQLTLAEQWNGKAWLVRKTPSPGDVSSGLSAVLHGGLSLHGCRQLHQRRRCAGDPGGMAGPGQRWPRQTLAAA